MRLSLLAFATLLPAAAVAAAPTSGPLRVVATTTLVADLVRQVAAALDRAGLAAGRSLTLPFARRVLREEGFLD